MKKISAVYQVPTLCSHPLTKLINYPERRKRAVSVPVKKPEKEEVPYPERRKKAVNVPVKNLKKRRNTVPEKEEWEKAEKEERKIPRKKNENTNKTNYLARNNETTLNEPNLAKENDHSKNEAQDTKKQ